MSADFEVTASETRGTHHTEDCDPQRIYQVFPTGLEHFVVPQMFEGKRDGVEDLVIPFDFVKVFCDEELTDLDAGEYCEDLGERIVSYSG